MTEMKTMTVGSNTYEVVDETARTQIAAIEIPENVSELANDAGYLTEETDPTVPDWAKASSKPSYTKSEVGLGNVDNVKQYSVNNPPPYPVTSVNGQTGDINLAIPTVPTKVTAFTNDAGYITSIPSEYVTETELAAKKYLTSVPSEYVTESELSSKGYITGYTETDPTVPSWAKASSKPSYTKSEVGLSNVDNVKQYSASNPPPYPVTSVNGKTGAVNLSIPTVPTNVSAFTNDANYAKKSEIPVTSVNGQSGAVHISANSLDTVTYAEYQELSGKQKDTFLTNIGAATLEEGTIFVEGSGTTDSTAKTSTWIGTSSRITSYYDGLAIRYKIGVVGQSEVTLNINGLGAKIVYRFGTTKLTTQFPVGSIITLIYHEDLNDGCWVTNDYDANTNTYQRLYESTKSNVEYPITARYNTTTGSSYYAEYGRYSTGVTLNPYTNTITAETFKGDLNGTAARASSDVNGYPIAGTYVKNDDLVYEDWYFTLEDGTTVKKKVALGTGINNEPV